MSSPGLNPPMRHTRGRALAAFTGFVAAALLVLNSNEGRSLTPESSAVLSTDTSSARLAAVRDVDAGADAAPALPRPLPREYCMIHVHGFHHSGTGVARHFLNESFGHELSSDMWYARGEAEGHNYQHVYMHDKARGQGKRRCLGPDHEKSKMWGRIWYCPKQVKDVRLEGARVDWGKRLWEEWAPTWDLTKPYLIQKSPMFDVKLLDRLNIQEFAPQSINAPDAKGGTIHVIVMRHPLMSWSYFRYMYEYEHLLFNWLDAWEHVLRLLATGSVEKFAVVQYEVMSNPGVAPVVKDELKALVRADCGIESEGAPLVDVHGELIQTDRHMRRRLEYHSSGGVSEHHLKMGTRFLTACRRDADCNALIPDLNQMIGGLGYKVNDLQGFHGHYDPILFSHRNPPPMELVNKLKRLVDKHIGTGSPIFDPRAPKYETTP